MEQRIMIRLQGVTLTLITDNDPFFEHLKEHFLGIPCVFSKNVPSDITVRLRYLKGTRADHENYFFNGYDRLDLLGYRTYLGFGRLDWNRIWELMGLKISFQNDHGKHYITAVFHELIDSNYAFYLIKRLIRRKYFRNRKRDFFNQLIEYLIYHSITWYLEEQRGIHLMHASAVEINGRGILFSGLSGAGKSTISAYLFSAHNGKFLSDNLIFYDQDKIYSCFEPILLTGFSRALLASDDPRITFTNKDAVYRRNAVLLSNESLVSETTPNIVCILRFSNEVFIQSIPTDRAVAKIMNNHELTGELKRYYIYASMMNSLSPERILQLERIRSLQKLLGRARCFEVGIRQGFQLKEDIDTTIGKLL